MTNQTDKDFDCISFKRQVQEQIFEEIKDLTIDEQVDYFSRRAQEGPLGEWWRKIQCKTDTAGTER